MTLENSDQTSLSSRIVSHDEPESNPSILEAISKWLSTKWALLKTFMFVKIILSFLGPIKTSGLYYYDIYTDFYLMQTLFNNCHPNYGYASLVIIFTSYITTVLFLTFRGNQKPIIALCFPIYHIANIFDQIKNNNIAILNGDELPEEPNAAKRFAYQIVFLESTSESVLQLCLNCLVIRQFGLSVNSTERFIQVTGLFSSLMCICISFGQRQIILKEKEVYGIFTTAMAKAIMVWMVPLLIFLVTMYMIAFKENSLVHLIFSMGIMLHPIVTIPISIAVNFIGHCITKCSSKNGCLSSKRKYCFSMVSYFVMISGCQVYLTLMWEKLNSHYLKDNKSTLTTAFAFYTFNQCDCDQSESYSCTLSEGKTPQFNIEDYLDLLGSLSTLPYFLIGKTAILLLFHLCEIHFDVAIPMFQFILGTTYTEYTLDVKMLEEIELPNIQSSSSSEEPHKEQVDQTCETTDVSKTTSKINLENQQELHSSHTKNKNGKWFNHQTLSLIISISYIIAIGLVPLIFSKANFWNDRECKAGFYDANSDVRILKCVDCRCNKEGTIGNSNICEKNATNGACSKKPGCKKFFTGIYCEECITGYTGERCDVCESKYFRIDSSCQSCGCNINGSISHQCSSNGTCTCKRGYIGGKCDDCKSEYYKRDNSCQACDCDSNGRQNNMCDSNGKCDCKAGYDGEKCNGCANEYYKIGSLCQACECEANGAENNNCDTNGQCNCKIGHDGEKCDVCAMKYFRNGSSCQSCDCDFYGSLSGGQCSPNGICICERGYSGTKCNFLLPGSDGSKTKCKLEKFHDDDQKEFNYICNNTKTSFTLFNFTNSYKYFFELRCTGSENDFKNLDEYDMIPVGDELEHLHWKNGLETDFIINDIYDTKCIDKNGGWSKINSLINSNALSTMKHNINFLKIESNANDKDFVLELPGKIKESFPKIEKLELKHVDKIISTNFDEQWPSTLKKLIIEDLREPLLFDSTSLDGITKLNMKNVTLDSTNPPTIFKNLTYIKWVNVKVTNTSSANVQDDCKFPIDFFLNLNQEIISLKISASDNCEYLLRSTDIQKLTELKKLKVLHLNSTAVGEDTCDCKVRLNLVKLDKALNNIMMTNPYLTNSNLTYCIGNIEFLSHECSSDGTTVAIWLSVLFSIITMIALMFSYCYCRDDNICI